MNTQTELKQRIQDAGIFVRKSTIERLVQDVEMIKRGECHIEHWVVLAGHEPEIIEIVKGLILPLPKK